MFAAFVLPAAGCVGDQDSEEQLRSSSPEPETTDTESATTTSRTDETVQPEPTTSPRDGSTLLLAEEVDGIPEDADAAQRADLGALNATQQDVLRRAMSENFTELTVALPWVEDEAYLHVRYENTTFRLHRAEP